jgi:hypothetical protein
MHRSARRPRDAPSDSAACARTARCEHPERRAVITAHGASASCRASHHSRHEAATCTARCAVRRERPASRRAGERAAVTLTPLAAAAPRGRHVRTRSPPATLAHRRRGPRADTVGRELDALEHERAPPRGDGRRTRVDRQVCTRPLVDTAVALVGVLKAGARSSRSTSRIRRRDWPRCSRHPPAPASATGSGYRLPRAWRSGRRGPWARQRSSEHPDASRMSS